MSKLKLICVAFTFAALLPQSASAQPAKISRFTVPGPGSVNTWLIENDASVVVIDMQRDTESAQAAIAQIRSIGKPVAALLLTHPHPDHIGGVDLFIKAFPRAPVVASKLTADEIRTDSRGFQKASRDALKDKTPASYPPPTQILSGSARIDIGGHLIEWREFGPAESAAATTYYLPATGALLAGDIVGNEVADFFLESQTSAWLRQLTDLSAAYPKATVLYPGHGAPGKPRELTQRFREYMQFFRQQVQRQIDNGEWNGTALSDKARKVVVAAVEAKYPGRQPVAAIPNLQELNADAIAKELSGRPGMKKTK